MEVYWVFEDDGVVYWAFNDNGVVYWGFDDNWVVCWVSIFCVGFLTLLSSTAMQPADFSDFSTSILI